MTITATIQACHVKCHVCEKEWWGIIRSDGSRVLECEGCETMTAEALETILEFDEEELESMLELLRNS